jgi:ParB-like nuclease family protein
MSSRAVEDDVPKGLLQWLKARDAHALIPDTALVPIRKGSKRFVLATVALSKLEFKTTRYNPRHPSTQKVNELAASISYLSLLTPLTCCFLEDKAKDEDDLDDVILIDGRHRFNAMQNLAEQDPEWRGSARVDLKIYYGLPKSDIFLLSTYLNRTRRNLRKGEYYKVIVEIYENRKAELEGGRGDAQTEKAVFEAISARELTNRNYDLSIGRVVGITAFDPEEDDAWYPMVGNRQNERILDGSSSGYCPLTAGNMAELLSYLCRPKPFSDYGEKRATEITNVVKLGGVFRKHILKPVESYGEATATTVACKHWPLSALGDIMSESQLFVPSDDEEWSPLSGNGISWSKIDRAIKVYRDTMVGQAEIVNEYRRTDELALLKEAWSYQTQKDQIKGPLLEAMRKQVPEIQPRKK